MMTPDLESRARGYAAAQGISIDFSMPLGFGQDGRVWTTEQKTAVKVFERPRSFDAELECYQRLAAAGVTEIAGLSVPRMVGFDESLMIVEMDIVRPPYILDFGKAYLDTAPEFSLEVLADWEESLVELFGDNVPRVKRVLRALQQYGIYYLDAKPGNIVFD